MASMEDPIEKLFGGLHELRAPWPAGRIPVQHLALAQLPQCPHVAVQLPPFHIVVGEDQNTVHEGVRKFHDIWKAHARRALRHHAHVVRVDAPEAGGLLRACMLLPITVLLSGYALALVPGLPRRGLVTGSGAGQARRSGSVRAGAGSGGQRAAGACWHLTLLAAVGRGLALGALQQRRRQRLAARGVAALEGHGAAEVGRQRLRPVTPFQRKVMIGGFYL